MGDNGHTNFWRWIEKALEGRKERKIGNVEFFRDGPDLCYDIPCHQWDQASIAADLVAFISDETHNL